MSEVVLTKENFDEVINGDKPVLVDFWASWCGPCQMLAPIISEVAEECQDKLVVGKVDVDIEKELASRFSIMSIPSLIIFQNGEVVETSMGYRPKEDLMEMINKVI